MGWQNAATQSLMQGIYYHSWLIFADLSHELLMFADASWLAHDVFLGHLSLPSFSKPGQLLSTFHTEYMYTVHTWLYNTCTYMYSVYSVICTSASDHQWCNGNPHSYNCIPKRDWHTYIQHIGRLYCRIRCLTLRRLAIKNSCICSLPHLHRTS